LSSIYIALLFPENLKIIGENAQNKGFPEYDILS